MNHNITTPTAKLSTSLKERLKRCGRYHSSPVGAPLHKEFKVSTTVGIPPCKKQCTHSVLSARSSPNNMKQSSNSNETLQENPPALLMTSSPQGITTKGDNSVPHSKNTMVSSHLLNKTNCKLEKVSNISCSRSQKSLEFNEENVSNCVESLTPVSSKQHCMANNTESGQQYEYQKKYKKCAPSKLTFDESPSKKLATSQTERVSESKNLDEHCASEIENKDRKELIQSRNRLKMLLQEKEEELRKLNMVKTYRSKNDLNHLNTLIEKWRSVSQQALLDLQNKLPEPRPPLLDIISHLQIDHDLIRYNTEEDVFI